MKISRFLPWVHPNSSTPVMHNLWGTVCERSSFEYFITPHLDKIPNVKRQTLAVFWKKKRHLEGQKQILRVATSTNVSTLKASFLVANCIAKAKKPIIIGEELVLAATKDIYRELFWEDEMKKVVYIPLSATTTTTTTTRRIDEIADDVYVQLLERINESLWYAIWVDDSTDVDNEAILLFWTISLPKGCAW